VNILMLFIQAGNRRPGAGWRWADGKSGNGKRGKAETNSDALRAIFVSAFRFAFSFRFSPFRFAFT
jgi:hypothetical protein